MSPASWAYLTTATVMLLLAVIVIRLMRKDTPIENPDGRMGYRVMTGGCLVILIGGAVVTVAIAIAVG